MNKEQVAGRVNTSKGKVKGAVGILTGSQKLRGERPTDQASGKVQSANGDTKEKAKGALKESAKKV